MIYKKGNAHQRKRSDCFKYTSGGRVFSLKRDIWKNSVAKIEGWDLCEKNVLVHTKIGVFS